MVSHPKTHILAFDADGALYGLKYFKLLIEVINRHGELLEEFGTKNDWLSDDDYYELKRKIDEIITELYTIDFNPDDLKELGSGITNPLFIAKIEKVWMDLLKTNPNASLSHILSAIFAEFIKYMEKINKDLLTSIFLAANKDLIVHLCNKMEMNDVGHYALLVASNRQSFFTDYAGMKQNGTRSIYLDICYLQTAMQHLLTSATCIVSQFCMADIFGQKKRGESFRNIFNEHMSNFDNSYCFFEHAHSIFDERKFSLIYAIAHDAVIHVLNELEIKDKDAEIDLDFYDDRLDILLPLAEKFTQYPELLPSNVRLNLFPYNGQLQMSPIASIKGTGVVDHNYRDNVKRMIKMCNHRLDDYSPIDTIYQLEIPAFLSARVTGLEMIPYKVNSFANLFQPKTEQSDKPDPTQLKRLVPSLI